MINDGAKKKEYKEARNLFSNPIGFLSFKNS
jgi:hypothetical protein